MPNIELESFNRELLTRLLNDPQLTMTIGFTFKGERYVRLISGSHGRGIKRETYIVQGESLSIVLRGLAAFLDEEL